MCKPEYSPGDLFEGVLRRIYVSLCTLLATRLDGGKYLEYVAEDVHRLNGVYGSDNAGI